MPVSFRIVALASEPFASLFDRSDDELRSMDVRRMIADEKPAVNEIPVILRSRLLSLRGYDTAAMLIQSKVVQGTDLEDAMHAVLADESVSYVHIHNAAPGCYNCFASRA